MRYTYETVFKNNKLVCTNFEEALKELARYTDGCISVYDNLKKYTLTEVLKTTEDIEMWREKLERDAAWLGKEYRWDPMENLLDEHTPPETAMNTETAVNTETAIEKAVNPSHYKAYIDDYQWLDAMSRIPTLKRPELFCAALELQIRKYLDRNGGKDASIQELKKARFYLEYMIQYMEGKNVSAAGVHEKLKD